MKSNLARTLIERGVIKRGSIIEAYHNVRSLSGQRNASVMNSFVVLGAQLKNGEVTFKATLPENVTQRDGGHPDPALVETISSENVITLDGMPWSRVAVSHNLTEDGEDSPTTSRRGRRKRVDEAENA